MSRTLSGLFSAKVAKPLSESIEGTENGIRIPPGTAGLAGLSPIEAEPSTLSAAIGPSIQTDGTVAYSGGGIYISGLYASFATVVNSGVVQGTGAGVDIFSFHMNQVK